MFAIHKIQITDKQQYVLNVDLSEAQCKKLWSRNYTTLVLGENGVGKSFLLKSIIDIFLFLENASNTNRKRKPRFQYAIIAIHLVAKGKKIRLVTKLEVTVSGRLN